MKSFLLLFLLPLIASAQLVISPAVNNNPFSGTGISLTGSTAAAVGTGLYNSGTGVAQAAGGTVYFEVYSYVAKCSTNFAVSIGDQNATTGGMNFSGFGQVTGLFPTSSNTALGITTAAVERARFNASGLTLGAGGPGAATTVTQYQSKTTAIADNTATAVATVTIPNAAQSATIRVVLVGIAGAGGSVGASEANASVEYLLAVTRTAGVNATVSISAGVGSATTSVAGGTVLAITGTASAISGAVGASNTFTINATIAHTLGSSTNHVCIMFAELINSNATGITIN